MELEEIVITPLNSNKLDNFQYNELEKMITDFKTNTNRIKYLLSIKLYNNVDILMRQNSNIANDIKSLFEKNKQFLEKELRLKQIINDFYAHLNIFNKLISEYNEKNKVQSCLDNNDFSEKKTLIDKDNGNIISHYTGNILHSQNVKKNIDERHQEIQNIYQNIVEIQQIMSDLSHLINSQGEVLDNIECNVTQSYHHINEGLENINEAKNNKQNNRFCCFVVIFILIMIILIVIVAVTTSVK
jgi:t-SNARE complex subunit (syntaxin)